MIVVRDKDELLRLIDQRIKKQGHNCSLNDIDVSKIDDMSGLFYCSKFTGDLSRWNLSNVVDVESISEDSPSLGYMWSNMMKGIE